MNLDGQSLRSPDFRKRGILPKTRAPLAHERQNRPDRTARWRLEARLEEQGERPGNAPFNLASGIGETKDLAAAEPGKFKDKELPVRMHDREATLQDPFWGNPPLPAIGLKSKITGILEFPVDNPDAGQ